MGEQTKRLNLKPRFTSRGELNMERQCYYNGTLYNIINYDSSANRLLLVARGNKYDVQKVDEHDVIPVMYGIHSVTGNHDHTSGYQAFIYFIDEVIKTAVKFTIDGVNMKCIVHDRIAPFIDGNKLQAQLAILATPKRTSHYIFDCTVICDEMLNTKLVLGSTTRVTNFEVDWVTVGILMSEHKIMAIPNIQGSKITGYTTLLGNICALAK